MAASARSRRRLSSLSHHVRVARLRSVFRGIQRRSRCRSCRDTSVLTGAFSYRMVALAFLDQASQLGSGPVCGMVYGPSIHSSRHLGFFSRPLFGSCRRRGTGTCCSSLPTSHVSGSRATANQRRACRTGARASGLSFLLTTSHVEQQ